MEYYFTQIEERQCGFVVSTINPYRILARIGSRKTAELCQSAVEAAIDTLTTKWPDQDRRPHRWLVTGEKPKLGVIPGGKGAV